MVTDVDAYSCFILLTSGSNLIFFSYDHLYFVIDFIFWGFLPLF